ncbi:Leucine-responsive regulatory protein [Ensifer adhaerens]|nr:Leucine-responsive regulatory protein [Ensifer adhaerens]
MPDLLPQWFAYIAREWHFGANDLRHVSGLCKHAACMRIEMGVISVIDERDRKLLALLQQDGSMPVGELADRVNLSLSACSRRIQRLEEAGYIARRIVVLDRERMGVPTTVFAMIKTAHHSDEWIETFRRAISDIPEIVEAHRLTGNYDYIVKVVLPRVEHYDVVYKQIVRKVELFDVSASISMEILKSGTAVPVDYAE